MKEEYTVINDKAIIKCIIDDLKENYNYTEKEARKWAEEEGESVVNDMWDAYSYYFETYAVYKEN